MSKDGIVFVSCMIILALMGQKFTAVASLLGSIIFFWFCIIITIKLIKKYGRDLWFITKINVKLSPNINIEEIKLHPDLLKAKGQILDCIQAQGDTIKIVNERYAVLIGVAPMNSELPPYYDQLIIKRILFAYYKKYGNTTQRFFNPYRLTIKEGLAPIPICDKVEFDQFCLR